MKEGRDRKEGREREEFGKVCVSYVLVGGRCGELLPGECGDDMTSGRQRAGECGTVRAGVGHGVTRGQNINEKYCGKYVCGWWTVWCTMDLVISLHIFCTHVKSPRIEHCRGLGRLGRLGGGASMRGNIM